MNKKNWIGRFFLKKLLMSGKGVYCTVKSKEVIYSSQ